LGVPGFEFWWPGNRLVALLAQIVGIKEVADRIWLFSFMEYDLGFFDQDEGRVEPTANLFIPVPEKL
jgi:putative transposase